MFAFVDEQNTDGWTQVKLQGVWKEYDAGSADAIDNKDQIPMCSAAAREAMRRLYQKLSWGATLSEDEKRVSTKCFPGYKLFHVHVGVHIDNHSLMSTRDLNEFVAGEKAYKAVKAFLELSPRLTEEKRYTGYKTTEPAPSAWVENQ